LKKLPPEQGASLVRAIIYYLLVDDFIDYERILQRTKDAVIVISGVVRFG
jgi:hypothetical protein